MAEPKMQPCPKCDGTNAKIFPSYGGKHGDLTSYVAECQCGVKVDDLSPDGTRRGAVRDWNRWAKEQKRTPGVPVPSAATFPHQPPMPGSSSLEGGGE